MWSSTTAEVAGRVPGRRCVQMRNAARRTMIGRPLNERQSWGPMDLTEDAAAIGGIDVTTEAGRTLVRLWGEVDAALRTQASFTMAQALASTAPVVVDATDVTFIDSSGLAFLLQLHLAANEIGQPVTLRDPKGEVVERLRMIGMGAEIELESLQTPA